jgi:putative MFS transporter
VSAAEAAVSRPRRPGGITYHRPWAFWTGVILVTAGVILHLPMYIGSADTGFHMAGMPMDLAMQIGMLLILVGLAATLYGLVPRLADVSEGYVARLRVRALDDAKIRGTHIGLLLVMAAAITIDVMKPTTFAFIAPGASMEYGLRSPLNPGASVPFALYPLAGISGTVIGSFLWGWLGDRIGRRASILLSAVIFIATAVCGTMPNFTWNLITCFIMGLGVGGMLPIAFALVAETIPARHRGWLLVLIGGDVAGAFILTSWLAAVLIPDFSWRIMWLLGLPTGVLLIVLNRWIPESPRFLLQQGREEEARAVMERYGATVAYVEESELEVEEEVSSRYAQLFRHPFLGLSAVVLLLGLGIGLVTYGFQLWIPSNLQTLGFSEVEANTVLRDSALVGFPLNFLVAWAYGFWSSKKTIILLTIVTAAALLGFVVAGDGVVQQRALLFVLLVVPTWGISSMTSVLSAYSSEVYPTKIRSRGTGLAAGAGKAGGVLVIALVAAAVATPGIRATALIGGIPLLLATVALIVYGVETRKRRLEAITAEELGEPELART